MPTKKTRAQQRAESDRITIQMLNIQAYTATGGDREKYDRVREWVAEGINFIYDNKNIELLFSRITAQEKLPPGARWNHLSELIALAHQLLQILHTHCPERRHAHEVWRRWRYTEDWQFQPGDQRKYPSDATLAAARAESWRLKLVN